MWGCHLVGSFEQLLRIYSMIMNSYYDFIIFYPFLLSLTSLSQHGTFEEGPWHHLAQRPLCRTTRRQCSGSVPGVQPKAFSLLLSHPCCCLLFFFQWKHQTISNWCGTVINSCVIPNSLEDLGRTLYRNPSELWLLCATDTSATLSAICTRTIRNFTACWTRTFRNLASYLHQNSPEACLLSAIMPSNSPQTLLAICTGTLRNFISHLHQNPPEPCLLSAPEPAGTLSAICTGRNSLELYQLSPPEPSGTSSPFFTGTLGNLIICTGTLRNLSSHLPRSTPERHQPSAPEPSGTSSAICTGTLRNPPEPSPEPAVATAPDRTKAILG